MGRIRQMIRVKGRDCWTLFDSGARNTYVVPNVASLLNTEKLNKPFRSSLGGKVREIRDAAILQAELEGRSIATQAVVVDDIGKDEDGKPLEILFGALAMQQWGIRLIPELEKLDLTHFPEEFVEFKV
ncbi:MAG: hypothetical protein ACREEM_22465 [Blastocatellia bacterium]